MRTRYSPNFLDLYYYYSTMYQYSVVTKNIFEAMQSYTFFQRQTLIS